MSTNFFSGRGFNPFGASLFGPNANPSAETKGFFGLSGTPSYDSDIAKQNVWSGVLGAYKDTNAPQTQQKWLQFQQPTENAGYQIWKGQNPAGSFADYAARRDYASDWEALSPEAAGRSNGYIRYRVQ